MLGRGPRRGERRCRGPSRRGQELRRITGRKEVRGPNLGRNHHRRRRRIVAGTEKIRRRRDLRPGRRIRRGREGETEVRNEVTSGETEPEAAEVHQEVAEHDEAREHDEAMLTGGYR